MDQSNPVSPAMRRILNQMRKQNNLPRVEAADAPVKITRALIWQIAVTVWKKYPQALTDPNYQLGELTLALVEQEISQRIDDLRRGVVVKQAALKDYFN